MFARWSVAAAVLVACAMGGLWIGQPGEREETSGVSVAEVRPGTFRAELELPGRWASRYGRTVRNARGVWVFHGKNMDGDVLFRIR